MKRIAIIGGGESGTGAALLAKKMNLNVFVSDYGTIADDYKKELKKNKIPFEEKGHDFERIDKAEVIVKSPGIPGETDVIRYFRLRQKRIVSEIEFASGFYDGRIIGITGTNGKTTTTKLCHHLLKQAGLDVGMGGNVGISFSRLLLTRQDYDWVVLELSSFQLEDINAFEVFISVILNITPDHLDRYDYSFYNYAKSKWNLAMHTHKKGCVILNETNGILKKLATDLPIDNKIWWVGDTLETILASKETGSEFDMKVKGRHNAFNAAVVVLIARKLGISENKIAEGLSTFLPVEHRMEIVDTYNGIEFVNDSKSTNIDSCIVALEAFEDSVVWIAGGTDKGNDYSRLEDAVRKRVCGIVCLTKDDSKIRSAFEFMAHKIRTTENIDEAVQLAVNLLEGGGTVLLSPACASFDLFKNYEHRGNSFKMAVQKYLNELNK